jgi:hypothetical protein
MCYIISSITSDVRMGTFVRCFETCIQIYFHNMVDKVDNRYCFYKINVGIGILTGLRSV